ncbi:MAG TPA: hypothetical protein VM120_11070, partial [Bryobacteraceae bacterium]|nr:hypothetical protein [Bryobacteraceae bacterium]
VTADSQPAGDITIWDEILFPLDPELADRTDLGSIAVSRWEPATKQMVEESYRCQAGGLVVVTLRNRTAGYERSWPLGRWAVKTKPVAPVRKRRTPSPE